MLAQGAIQSTCLGVATRWIRPSSLPYIDERRPQHAYELRRGESGNGADYQAGTTSELVTWWSDRDPENPHNWPMRLKIFVTGLMSVLNFSVYIGSSIYTPGIAGPNLDSITEHFGTSETVALLGLTLFVLGYGVGPLVFCPLSEFPSVGRLPLYISTLIVFVVLQFPTIYAPNIATLLALRFWAGFFGSPVLAVGGATIADMFEPKHLSYAIGLFTCGGVCGPVFGPLFGGYAYRTWGWRGPLWVLTGLSASSLVSLILLFPETSGKTILYHRMLRLRKNTGDARLTTHAVIDAARLTGSQVVRNTLWRPLVLFREPILLVFNAYSALIYGLLYLWFESFPLVFQDVHGFNPGEAGLSYLGIFVGSVGGCAAFLLYLHRTLYPIVEANGGSIPSPEMRLPPTAFAGLCIPIAMFGFGWSGQYEQVHWIVPIIFTAIFGVGMFVMFQIVFAYLGDVYFTEMGSVMTLNTLFRASFGAAFPLFANALFKNLGVGGGNSLLGGMGCLFAPAPFLLMKYGKTIRHASRYAKSDDH